VQNPLDIICFETHMSLGAENETFFSKLHEGDKISVDLQKQTILNGYQSDEDNSADHSFERSLFFQHLSAIFIRRYQNAKRDWRACVCQILIPIIFIVMGLSFVKFEWIFDQPRYLFGLQGYLYTHFCFHKYDDGLQQ